MIRVWVAIALPGDQEVVELEVANGSTVGDALRAARIAERFPELELDRARFGIWSRPCAVDAVLRDGDRVEVYRELKADAKAMRRARARLKPASPRSRSGP